MALRRTSTANKRRKGFLAIALPWVKRFGLWLGIIVFVIWIGTWVVLSGAMTRSMNWVTNQLILASGKAGFKVEALLVEGRHYTDATFLKSLINVAPGDPLFSLSPERTKALLEQAEWVDQAHVERRLPGTIYIKLEERQPSALWLRDGELSLIDKNGKPIQTDDLTPFADLIIVSGDDGPRHVYDLLQILNAEPSLRARVRAVERIEQRRWDLKLDNGLVLKLPEDANIGLALKRTVEAQDESQLLDRPGLEFVDLRQEDRLILRNQPGMASGSTPAAVTPPSAQQEILTEGAI
jgi:cell division protein FtsQ